MNSSEIKKKQSECQKLMCVSRLNQCASVIFINLSKPWDEKLIAAATIPRALISKWKSFLLIHCCLLTLNFCWPSLKSVFFFSRVEASCSALGRMPDFRKNILRHSRVFDSKHNHKLSGLAWDYAEGRNFWHSFIPRTRRDDNNSGLTWKTNQENRLIRIVHWL